MTFYRCDPRKNSKCRKTTCYLKNGKCSLTSDVNCKCDGTFAIQGNPANYVTTQQRKIQEEMGYGSDCE